MIKTGYSIWKLFKTRFDFLFFLFCSASLFAQPPLFRTYNYIDTYAQEAVRQMVEYKIPASVILDSARFCGNAVAGANLPLLPAVKMALISDAESARL